MLAGMALSLASQLPQLFVVAEAKKRFLAAIAG
jgi:hypothetical protein